MVVSFMRSSFLVVAFVVMTARRGRISSVERCSVLRARGSFFPKDSENVTAGRFDSRFLRQAIDTSYMPICRGFRCQRDNG